MEAHSQQEQIPGAQEHFCQACPSAAHGQQVSCPSKAHRMGTNTQQNPPTKPAGTQLTYLGCSKDPGSCPHTAVTAIHCAKYTTSFYSLVFSKLPFKFSITNLFPMNSCTMLKFAQEMLDTTVVWFMTQSLKYSQGDCYKLCWYS